ncbi:uncharacterized protein LOC130974734 [Arachis stenosperma]|uniref:uncharacterized protein LOC130974734 n=1 Tax=Arachis stenosperma TaxID=217475 RepID=UPI0025AD8832|nr:uncharacterized protein LOC130974734 [Arachis stenosperma]
MESLENSLRVSTEEEDLVQRSTKKVKTRDKMDLNQPRDDMEILHENTENAIVRSKATYKESLLKPSGPTMEDDMDLHEQTDEDSPNPEDRWYKDSDDHSDREKSFDPCPTIKVTQEEFEEWCKPWRASLIVKVLGKRLNLGFMEQRLKRDWVKKGTINVIDMDRDYFLVHFSNEDDYSHALTGGPWMVAGHYLIVQCRRPFFLESEKAVRKIAAWIRIPNLPIELYNHHFLWRVGSAIGTMLKIDRATSIHSRGRFARICVEIDLTKKLVPRISVLGSILNIEYEGLHLICFKCGLYGHRSEQCSEPSEDAEEGGGVSGSRGDGSRSDEQKIIALNEDQSENSIKSGEQNQRIYDQSPPNFGPWMMVRKQFRRKSERYATNQKSNFYGKESLNNMEGEYNSATQGEESGSRFNVLLEEGLDDMQGLHGNNKSKGNDQPSTMKNGSHQQAKQKENGPSIKAHDKILRQGAGKVIKKGTLIKGRPTKVEKGPKVSFKKTEQEHATSDPQMAISKHGISSSRDSNVAAMELEMLEDMRRIQKEQWKIYEESKTHEKFMESHVVTNSFITQVPGHIAKERDPSSDSRNPKNSEEKPPDQFMEDVVVHSSSDGHGASAQVQ